MKDEGIHEDDIENALCGPPWKDKGRWKQVANNAECSASKGKISVSLG